MKVILFGATGMVGQAVLRECLADDTVSAVLAVGRAPLAQTHPKLRQLVHADLFELSAHADELRGYDAGFFCLGISSAGMSEADYRRVTHDLTLAVAERLARLNPAMTFVYVSGAGTDSSERGRSMWARVKGQTENALLRLPFRAVYLFRPAFIQPLHGELPKTRWYRWVYAVSRPLFPLVRRLFPRHASTTVELGRAMIAVAQRGAPTTILESSDINRVAAG